MNRLACKVMVAVASMAVIGMTATLATKAQDALEVAPHVVGLLSP